MHICDAECVNNHLKTIHKGRKDQNLHPNTVKNHVALHHENQIFHKEPNEFDTEESYSFDYENSTKPIKNEIKREIKKEDPMI